MHLRCVYSQGCKGAEAQHLISKHDAYGFDSYSGEGWGTIQILQLQHNQ